MLNTSDYLIPLKFVSLIVQTIFSVSALISKVILSLFLISIQYSNSILCDNNSSCNTQIIVASSILIGLEVIEILMIATGITIFHNRLSLFQILFHMITSMLYIWYIFFDWKGNKIWAMMVLGGWVPIFFEIGGGISSYLFYYKTLRLN